MTRKVLLLLVVLLSDIARTHKGQFRGPAQCLNHASTEVDWWFIYKENSGMRYLYYDSMMAAVDVKIGRNATPFPLNNEYKLDDPGTSPIVKTIMSSRPLDKEERQSRSQVSIRDTDNTVFVSINDETPSESAFSKSKTSSEDSNTEEIIRQMNNLKLKKSKTNMTDAFGSRINPNSAHSKLFTAIQIDYPKEEAMPSSLQMYIIQHSTPKFPYMSYNEDNASSFGSDQPAIMRRSAISKDASQIFPPNTFSRSQHFVCVSVRQQVEMNSDGTEIFFERSRLAELAKSNALIALFHTMAVIHAPVIGTNYIPWLPEMRVYHQIFDVRNKWTSDPIIPGKDDFRTTNQPRIASSKHDYILPSHLFPMWATTCRYSWKNGRILQQHCNKGLRSIRSSKSVCDFSDKNRWKKEDGSLNELFLSHTMISSTSRHNQLHLSVLGKSGFAILNIYDDLVPQLLVPNPSEMTKNEAAHVALIVQTQLNSSFLETQHRLIASSNKNPKNTKVTIVNSTGTKIPIHPNSVKDGEEPFKLVNATDSHAKIAYSVPVGSDIGAFNQLVCFGDLNRNRSQAVQKNGKNGRGGAAWCTSSPIISNLFYGFQVATEDLMPQKEEETLILDKMLTKTVKNQAFFLQNSFDNKTRIYAMRWQLGDDLSMSRGLVSIFQRPNWKNQFSEKSSSKLLFENGSLFKEAIVDMNVSDKDMLPQETTLHSSDIAVSAKSVPKMRAKPKLKKTATKVSLPKCLPTAFDVVDLSYPLNLDYAQKNVAPKILRRTSSFGKANSPVNFSKLYEKWGIKDETEHCLVVDIRKIDIKQSVSEFSLQGLTQCLRKLLVNLYSREIPENLTSSCSITMTTKSEDHVVPKLVRNDDPSEVSGSSYIGTSQALEASLKADEVSVNDSFNSLLLSFRALSGKIQNSDKQLSDDETGRTSLEKKDEANDVFSIKTDEKVDFQHDNVLQPSVMTDDPPKFSEERIDIPKKTVISSQLLHRISQQLLNLTKSFPKDVDEKIDEKFQMPGENETAFGSNFSLKQRSMIDTGIFG